MGLPAAPGSADSSPGNMFTAGLHPHHPTLSHQERDWAGLLGPVGWIQTMNLLNMGLC